MEVQTASSLQSCAPRSHQNVCCTRRSPSFSPITLTGSHQILLFRNQPEHPRKERRDKGKKLIKPCDLVVLLWIAQQYAARLDHVQELLSRMPGRGGKQVSPSGLTLSAVLQVVDRWVTLGLVEYKRIYDGEPGWVWVTPYGLRMLHLSFARHTPAESTLAHLHQTNRVRLEVERRHPGYQWVSERMLRAELPRREEGSLVSHLPDAKVCAPKAIAVEVERSPKTPKELDDILTALLITGISTADVEHPLTSTTVWYFVTAHTRRSVEEARDRLPVELQARVKVYSLKAHWYAQRTIRKVKPHIDATSLAYDGFFDATCRGLDGTFAFEDGDAIYIGLDGNALREQAASIGRYVLEDCAHYATARKPGGLRTLTIIDEFGVLKTSNATNLYERVREAGMAMWASAQSYQGLGAERASVLSASSIKILHRCGEPQEVVKFAGWRDQPAFSQLIEEEEALISPESRNASKTRTAVRMQRVYAMPIEEVQQLSRGANALITGGLGAWCQVYPLALPPELLHEAIAFVETRPVMQPPSASTPPATPAAAREAQGQSGRASQGQRKKSSAASPSQGTQRVGTSRPQAPTPQPPSVPPESGESAQANEQRPIAEEDDSPVDF